MDQIRRHVNGGAEKIGLNVHVSADSFCRQDTVFTGESNVFSSTVSGSRLQDSQVFNSLLQGVIGVRALFAESTCRGLLAEGVVLHRVSIQGGEVMSLKDVVAETCELYGNWILEGNARIPTGIWHRAPRYKRITGDNGVDIGLTESTEGHALMACWRKPITKWLRYGPRLGTKHGWTAQQIEDARLFFQELLDVPIEGVIPSAT